MPRFAEVRLTYANYAVISVLEGKLWCIDIESGLATLLPFEDKSTGGTTRSVQSPSADEMPF